MYTNRNLADGRGSPTPGRGTRQPPPPPPYSSHPTTSTSISLSPDTSANLSYKRVLTRSPRMDSTARRSGRTQRTAPSLSPPPSTHIVQQPKENVYVVVSFFDENPKKWLSCEDFSEGPDTEILDTERMDKVRQDKVRQDNEKLDRERRDRQRLGGACPDPYCSLLGGIKAQPNYVEGMLLKTIDQSALFPCLHLVTFRVREGEAAPNGTRNSPSALQTPANRQSATASCVDSLDDVIRFQGTYEELDAHHDHSVRSWGRAEQWATSIFLVCQYYALPGQQADLEATWRVWSGAAVVAHSVPPEVSLVRVGFYKVCEQQQQMPHHPSGGQGGVGDSRSLRRSTSWSSGGSSVGAGAAANMGGMGGVGGPFTYLMVCELRRGRLHVSSVKSILQKLSYRQVGHPALYIIDHFF